MVTIKSLVKKHRYVGFICSSLEQFRIFLDTCREQQLVLSKSFALDKTPHIEDYDGLFEKYTNHLSGKCIALLVYKVHKGKFKEIQLYTRDYEEYITDKDGRNIYYSDWNKMTMIDFNQMMRDEKLNELGIDGD
jgi:predicted nucleic acid-binding Zn finger protein